jgi:hypothetical protein
MPLELNDNQQLKVDIKWMVQLIGLIVTLVWGYAKLDGRISALEHNLERTQMQVEDTYQWTKDWQTGGILPLDVEQNTRIDGVEVSIRRVEDLLIEEMIRD